MRNSTVTVIRLRLDSLRVGTDPPKRKEIPKAGCTWCLFVGFCVALLRYAFYLSTSVREKSNAQAIYHVDV